MTPKEATEAYIQETLRLASDIAWGAEGLAYPGPKEYAAAVRAQAEVFLRSVNEYLGQSLPAAQALARDRQDRLCLHPAQGHRANLDSRRVHVLLEQDVVTHAALDRPHWLVGVVPDRRW